MTLWTKRFKDAVKQYLQQTVVNQAQAVFMCVRIICSSFLVLLLHLYKPFIFKQLFYLASRLTFLCGSCNSCTLTPTCTHHAKHLQFMLYIPHFTVSPPSQQEHQSKAKRHKSTDSLEVKKPLTPLHPRSILRHL
jgi:hypothetical protein